MPKHLETTYHFNTYHFSQARAPARRERGRGGAARDRRDRRRVGGQGARGVVEQRRDGQARCAAGGPRVYAGVLDAFATIVRTEGVLALYKGFVPIVVRKVLWCSAFFLCYERLRVGLRAREKI